MSDLPDSTVYVDRKLALKLDKPLDPAHSTKSSISANGTFTYNSRYEVTVIYDKYAIGVIRLAATLLTAVISPSFTATTTRCRSHR